MRRVVRLISSLANQGLATAGALVLAIQLARSSTVEEFGFTSISLGLLAVGLTVSRAAVTTTQLLRGPGGVTSSVVSGGAAGSLLIGVVCLISSIAFLSSTKMVLSSAVIGASIPFVLAYDHYRLSFIQKSLTGVSAGLETFRFLIQIVPPIIVSIVATESANTAAFSWLASYVLCAVVAACLFGSPPSFSSFGTLIREDKRRYVTLGAESALNSLSANSAVFSSRVLVGASASAAIRGGFTISGGVSLLVLALTPLATMSFVTRLRAGASPYRLLSYWSMLFTSLGVSYAIAMLILPSSIGVQILGATWTVTKPVLIAFGVHVATRALVTGVPLLLRSADLTESALVLRVATSLITVCSVIIGAVLGQTSGIAWGLVAAQLLSSTLAFAYFVYAFSGPGWQERNARRQG